MNQSKVVTTRGGIISGSTLGGVLSGTPAAARAVASVQQSLADAARAHGDDLRRRREHNAQPLERQE